MTCLRRSSECRHFFPMIRQSGTISTNHTALSMNISISKKAYKMNYITKKRNSDAEILKKYFEAVKYGQLYGRDNEKKQELRAAIDYENLTEIKKLVENFPAEIFNYYYSTEFLEYAVIKKVPLEIVKFLLESYIGKVYSSFRELLFLSLGEGSYPVYEDRDLCGAEYAPPDAYYAKILMMLSEEANKVGYNLITEGIIDILIKECRQGMLVFLLNNFKFRDLSEYVKEAVNKNLDEVVVVMVQKGVYIAPNAIQAAEKHGSERIQEVLIEGRKNNKVSLYHAVKYENNDFVKTLVESGMGIPIEDLDLNFVETTFLRYRSRFIVPEKGFSKEERYDFGIEIIKYLIEQGVDPNQWLGTTPHTLLAEACSHSDFGLIVFLIEHGANPNYCGDPPLSYIDPYENRKIFEYLVDNGADVDSCKGSDFTPLQLAAAQDDIEFMTYLLENGADINGSRSCDQETPLMVATYNRNIKAIDFLVENGADPFYVSYHGDTALEYAKKYGGVEVTKHLLILMAKYYGTIS